MSYKGNTDKPQYIYCYYHEDKPIYVGMTCNVIHRYHDHKGRAVLNKRLGNPFYEFLREHIRKYGKMPDFKILMVADGKGWGEYYEREIEVMYRKQGYNLLNQRDCGAAKGSKMKRVKKTKNKRDIEPFCYPIKEGIKIKVPTVFTKTHYIYAYYQGEEPVYIGNTRDLNVRHGKHKADTKRKPSHPLYKHFKNLLEEGEEMPKPKVLIEVKNKEQGLEFERVIELAFREQGYNLLNQKTCGNDKGSKMYKGARKRMSEATKGSVHSEETRRKISKIHKGKTISEEAKRKISEANTGRKRSEEFRQRIREVNTGRKHSEESRRKRSEALKGKKHSEETKRKISKIHKGKTISEEHKNKLIETNSKKVLCYSLDNKILGEYSSIRGAGKQIGIAPTSISSVCRGKRKTAGGFKWKYKQNLQINILFHYFWLNHLTNQNFLIN